MSAVGVADDRWVHRSPGVSVARALGSTTRAGIFEHLQQEGAGLTVRDVAGVFDLHPNVARTHLETLADAGLVVVGRRKHPGGGRPAKLYRVREDAGSDPAPARLHGAPGTAVVIRLLADLVATDSRLEAVVATAHETAVATGRRLAGMLGVSRPETDIAGAAELAVRALRAQALDARVVRTGQAWADVSGLRGVFGVVRESHPELADALERGLLSGALAASGMPCTLSEAGALPDGSRVWRARPAAPSAGARAAVRPAVRVDARGEQRETGVVRAMRAITALGAGEVVEVLTEGPGSPAAFARWADRAGHELLGVERATDAAGRAGIRLLIRKGRA